MQFLKELQRRNVFRVAIGYIVSCWLLAQVADLVLENIGAPAWVMQTILLVLLLGFPVVVFFSWAYEVTPEGVKRESEIDRSQSITHVTAHKLDRSITLVLAIALAYFAYDKFFMPGRGETPAGPAAPATAGQLAAQPGASIAVLPFINMSDDEKNEYFSDGIAEELLNVLVRIEGLRVPSRTSSFTFRGSGLKVSEIGKELGVDHVLEGSVRKAGERIRVTAQLIDVKTDTHIWSETYTRQLDDIFAVQDEIAQAIVGALKVTLSGEEQAQLEQRPTDNVEAYNLYLLGRHYWNLRIPGQMSEAIEPLQKAVELDPRFEGAWAALADVYLLLPEYGEGTVAEHMPRALDATERALAINPDSAHALTTSAYIKAMHYYQWEEAETEFKHAIKLDPKYRTAYQWYAEMLAAQRRTDESLAQLDIAAEVDPLAPIIPHIKGWVSLWAGRLDEAEQHYLDALRLDPGFPYSIGNLAQTYLQQGKYDQARERWTEYGELVNADVSVSMLAADALENPELKERAIAAWQEIVPPTQPFSFPVFFVLLGRNDLALDLLLRNFEAGGPYAPHVNRILVFDPLREDPRFQEMLTRMNLWPGGSSTN